MVAKTLFLGDMEGQYALLENDISSLAGNFTEVVSLGNLISCKLSDTVRSSPNHQILQLWETIAGAYPTLKLMGPNEVTALNFPTRWTSAESNTILRSGWLSHTPEYITAVEDKERLLTHGGLTHGEWVSLGRPSTAAEAAEVLNSKYQQTLYQGPCLLLDGKLNPAANPIWADASLEVYPSWLYAGEECPFAQVHGGASLNTVKGRQAVADRDNPLAHLDSVEYFSFGSVVTMGETTFTGVDLNLTTHSRLRTLPNDKSFYLETSQ